MLHYSSSFLYSVSVPNYYYLLLTTARVSFFVNVDGKEKEFIAEVNKEVSHQVCGPPI